MRQFIIMLIVSLSLYANNITSNQVYTQTMRIADEIHFLLKSYGIKHDHNKAIKDLKSGTTLKPRNVWQKTYEIMIKINILRVSYGLPMIEPVNIAPSLSMNHDLVYEQVQRILTEIEIFKFRVGIKSKEFKIKKYTNKTISDVYYLLNNISIALDELNKTEFTPSYVFGESIRVYDDLSMILQHLNIKDNTIPSIRNDQATPSDTFTVAMIILNKISIIQSSVGISSVDFSFFRKANPNPSDVFTMVQMIISELQTIKSFIGLDTQITPAATQYLNKTPSDVDQLINWNLRKLELIDALSIRGENTK